MELYLEKWLATNKVGLEARGAVIENVRAGDIGYACKAVSLDIQYKGHFARVMLNCEGRLYAHILVADSYKTVFLFDETVAFNNSEFNGFMTCFIQLLIG